MKITVLDAGTLGNDISLSPLEKQGELTVYQTTSQAELEARLRADVIITNKVKLTAEALSKADGLKLICVAATGYDNIDTAYCKANGIAVCNIIGYSTDSVAQVTVAMALSLICRIPEYTAYVSSGRYSASGKANTVEPVYHETTSLTWGVVGLGNIGRKVARVASALGCRVIASRRSGADGEFECVGIDELVRTSDIISLHTPLNDGTRGLINKDRISAMKPTAILINVARGAVTDEAAVADAVKSGRLGGFGCDVYSAEPMTEYSPIYGIKDMPNVILTPHMAWGSHEARERCIAEMAENIASFFSGGCRMRVV